MQYSQSPSEESQQDSDYYQNQQEQRNRIRNAMINNDYSQVQDSFLKIDFANGIKRNGNSINTNNIISEQLKDSQNPNYKFQIKYNNSESLSNYLLNCFKLEMYSNFQNGLLTANQNDSLGCMRINYDNKDQIYLEDDIFTPLKLQSDKINHIFKGVNKSQWSGLKLDNLKNNDIIILIPTVKVKRITPNNYPIKRFTKDSQSLGKVFQLLNDFQDNFIGLNNEESYLNDIYHINAIVDENNKNEDNERRYYIKLNTSLSNVISELHLSSFFVIKIGSLTTLQREYQLIKNLSEIVNINFILDPNSHQSKNQGSSIAVENRLAIKLSKYLNQSQINAIVGTCKSESQVSMIHGPPGTGKTQVILGILSMLQNKSPKPSVLICAHSNCAIDEIITRILTRDIIDLQGNKIKPNIIRLGTSTEKRSTDLVQNVTLESIMKKRKHEFFHQVKDEIGYRRGDTENYERYLVENKLLRETHIIVCTLSNSGSAKLAKVHRSFDLCIIDESAQSTETSTLIPFQLDIKKFVMIGDHLQLPATVLSETSKKLGFETSFFERMQMNQVKSQMLKVQYRMHPQIRFLPSQLFYKGQIKDGPNILKQDQDQNSISNIKRRSVFIQLNSSQENRQSGETSLFNSNEIKVILELLFLIKNIWGTSRQNVGILSPQKKQVKNIKFELLKKGFFKINKEFVEVETIDGFQGREKDIIIFSTVRSNSTIGFLKDTRRMNVALTRAKYLNIVIGKETTLEMDQSWSSQVKFVNDSDLKFNLQSLNHWDRRVFQNFITENNYIFNKNLQHQFDIKRKRNEFTMIELLD